MIASESITFSAVGSTITFGSSDPAALGVKIGDRVRVDGSASDDDAYRINGGITANAVDVDHVFVAGDGGTSVGTIGLIRQTSLAFDAIPEIAKSTDTSSYVIGINQEAFNPRALRYFVDDTSSPSITKAQFDRFIFDLKLVQPAATTIFIEVTTDEVEYIPEDDLPTAATPVWIGIGTGSESLVNTTLSTPQPGSREVTVASAANLFLKERVRLTDATGPDISRFIEAISGSDIKFSSPVPDYDADFKSLKLFLEMTLTTHTRFYRRIDSSFGTFNEDWEFEAGIRVQDNGSIGGYNGVNLQFIDGEFFSQMSLFKSGSDNFFAFTDSSDVEITGSPRFYITLDEPYRIKMARVGQLLKMTVNANFIGEIDVSLLTPNTSKIAQWGDDKSGAGTETETFWYYVRYWRGFRATLK